MTVYKFFNGCWVNLAKGMFKLTKVYRADHYVLCLTLPFNRIVGIKEVKQSHEK